MHLSFTNAYEILDAKHETREQLKDLAVKRWVLLKWVLRN
jgi:hypothetical protein